MNPAIYLIPIFLVLFFVLYEQRRQKEVIIKKLINKKQLGDDRQMLELAKRFIGKECLVYTFNSQITGVMKEVDGTAILLESNGTIEAVNLDFVVRIREYPKNKNGKKKQVVLD